MTNEMTTWILLLRGINVGGKNRLPMEALRRYLSSLGLENVETYIQSGNAVFQASRKTAATLPAQLAGLIEEHHSFRPGVFVVSRVQLEKTIASNPFSDGESEPRTLHVFFLSSAPVSPDLQSLVEAKSPSERFDLKDDVFYLHAPEGVGRSKLATRVQKCLGVEVTARNWRTVKKLSEMASR